MRLEESWGLLGMSYKLEDICDYVKEKIDVSLIDENTYISTENMLPDKGGIIEASSLPSADKTQAFKKGDVLVSNIRPYFKKIWFSTFDGGCSNDVLVFRVKEGVSNRFLYYVLADDAFFSYSMSTAKGTKMPRGDKKALMKYDVPNISYEEQVKIASVLDVIDKKIIVNEEINDNLEEQALALFRQYFMDFAPYGGVAPSEWTEVSLDDVCTRITDGSHYSPADSPESPYPMYSVKDMETYGFNPTSCKHISEEDFQKMQKGDCVPLFNDILVAKDGSYLKEIFICSEEKDEAILSSIAIFRPNTSIIMPEILLYLLKQPSVRKDVGDNYVSGSALPRIVLKDFKKYRFMLPPMDEQQKIGSVLHAIRMQTKANIDEIQCLSSLRDALLPKLMSGELDISRLDI